MSEAVAAYKRMLAAIIERRPSGTRQRLAIALTKNRSFVSQITNPAYATPIPASHIATIFEVCHFSGAERREFTTLYGLAHPKKALRGAKGKAAQPVTLPDLGDAEKNARLHALVSNFVRDVARLINEEREEKRQ